MDQQAQEWEAKYHQAQEWEAKYHQAQEWEDKYQQLHERHTVAKAEFEKLKALSK